MEPAGQADVAVPAAKLVIAREVDRTKLWLKRSGGEQLFYAAIYDGFDQVEGLELKVTDKQAEVELDPWEVTRFLDAIGDFADALSATSKEAKASA